MNHPQNDGAYLSDDTESHLRMLAPAECRLCQHLSARRSIITGRPEIKCGKPEDGANAEILAALLMNLAKKAECGFFAPFKGLI